jgi:hypothetical protein
MYGHFISAQKTSPAETAGDDDIFVMYRFNPSEFGRIRQFLPVRSPADCDRRTDNHTDDRCRQQKWSISGDTPPRLHL